MFEHRDPSQSQFRTYELKTGSFKLYAGAAVYPDEIIGIDVNSNQPVMVDDGGQIATAYFNPMNDSFLFMIQLCTEPQRPRFYHSITTAG